MGLLHDLGLYSTYTFNTTTLRANYISIMKEESKEMYIFVALIFV